jgi:secondary thiamine-phosphate synthase enzyme
MEILLINTGAREELIDVTDRLRRLARDKGWRDGLLCVYSPHTTAGVTVNEAADPSVARDIVVNLAAFIPRRGDYRHLEGNSDAHIKTSLMGSSTTLLLDAGELQLGTWQGVYFCEFDGPRSRKLWVKHIVG